MLKNYEDNQKEIVVAEESIPSGVQCTEVKCIGEMMAEVPAKWHPELKGLRRAHCGTCNWAGWV